MTSGAAPSGIIATPWTWLAPRRLTACLACALVLLSSACSRERPAPRPEPRAAAEAESTPETDAEARLHEAALRGRADEVRELLAAGTGVEARNRGGTTALMAAAIGGHLEIARLLLEAGAAIDATRPGGSTAVALALQRPDKHGPAAVALLLLGHGAEIAGLEGEESFLLDAVRARKWELAEKLLAAGAPAAGFANRDRLLEAVRAEDMALLTAILRRSRVAGPAIALCVAVKSGDAALVDELLGQGLEDERCEKSLPLAVAAGWGNLYALERILQQGPDLDQVGKDGRTSLMTAAKYDQVDAARMLLEHGADPNQRGSRAGKGVASSALMEAADRGSVEMIDLLLEAGADVNLADERGGTALFAALFSNQRKTVAQLMAAGAGFEGASVEARQGVLVQSACNREIVAHVLSVGADPTVTDRQGELPLAEAARCGAQGSARLLLDAGADVDAFDSTGRTALMTAAKYRGRPMIDYLVEQGANLELADERGWTALTIASAERKTTEAMEALLAAGADIEHADAEGATPLMRAAAVRGREDHVRVLVDAGAALRARDNADRTAAVYFGKGRRKRPSPEVLETREGTIRFANSWFTRCWTEHTEFAEDQLAECYVNDRNFSTRLRLFSARRARADESLSGLDSDADLVDLPRPEEPGSVSAVKIPPRLYYNHLTWATLVRLGRRTYRVEVRGSERHEVELGWVLASVAESLERGSG